MNEDAALEGSARRISGEAELRSETRVGSSPLIVSGYLLLGLYFGVVLAKSEVISWFRIQEMFRFQGFHMYGVLGSAVVVAMLSLRLLRRFPVRSLSGEAIHVPAKERTRGLVRYWAGGAVFGAGWALLGACPGPIYVLIGHGETVYVVALMAALVGTWTYGWLKPRLPH